MRGYTGEIIFTDSGEKCDVKAVYGPRKQIAGNFVVTLNREEGDWYEIKGKRIYIKTSTCPNLALGGETVLYINANGYGTLYVEGDHCLVEDDQCLVEGEFQAALKVVQGIAESLTDAALKEGYLQSQPLQELSSQAGGS